MKLFEEAGPPPGLGATPLWPHRAPIVLMLSLIFSSSVTRTYGGCEFPSHWTGKWFQSGVGLLDVNRTSIESKGECYDGQGDKYLIYDRLEDCYRCMVIHEKHYSVLQYKETYCDQKATLAELCYSITGDAALLSMFRKSPEPKPVPCPFKAAPFTFTYNRGSGECSNPPSRAESCTDDSRLVLKYQACPDIQSTESNIEELVCVATWKEGSTRYLVGKLNQVSRRSAVASDEDQYRCFIYERAAVTSSNGGSRVSYHIAQSGDATCNGLQSAVEGSRTIRLTTADSHHGRCRFPSWITDHHTWFSLDHSRIYKFSLRNATLRITTASPAAQGNMPIASPVASATDGGGGNAGSSGQAANVGHNNRHHNHENVLKSNGNIDGGSARHGPHSSAAGPNSGTANSNSNSGGSNGGDREGASTGNYDDEGEVRVVCHSILGSVDGKRVQIVAHVTAGCDSGYVCMVFHKRDSSVIEIQQSEELHENTDDACSYFDPTTIPYTTLIAPSLHPSKCPHPGRYTVIGSKGPTSGGADPNPANGASNGGRKRRRQAGDSNHGFTSDGPGADLGSDQNSLTPAECLSHDYDALAFGCSSTSHDTMEFRSPCVHQPISEYICHGSWRENNTYYLIASPVARKSTDALRYCLVYTLEGDGVQVPGVVPGAPGTHSSPPQNSLFKTTGATTFTTSTGGFAAMGGAGAAPGVGAQHLMSFTPPVGTLMRLSGLSDSCHRHIVPGSSGLWAFNFTTKGGCTRSGDTGAAGPSRGTLPPCLLLLVVAILSLFAQPLR